MEKGIYIKLLLKVSSLPNEVDRLYKSVQSVYFQRDINDVIIQIKSFGRNCTCFNHV